MARLTEAEEEELQSESVPTDVNPMLATLVHEPFSNEDWIYERKLDGVRTIAEIEDGEVRLRSRNHNDMTGHWPEIVEALQSRDLSDMVLDGEIVTFEGDVTSFSQLQQRMQIDDPERARATGVPVYYYVFDLLHYAGFDVTGLPLRRRKTLLKDALDWSESRRLRYVPHRNGDGEEYYQEACRKGWEGLIAKEADSPYVHSRSRKWLKFKCSMRQELVIGGFTKPEGNRLGFGAIGVGYYDDGQLLYAGKVGTGFNDDELKSLRERFDDLTRESSPFDSEDDDDLCYVEPKLVCEVGFTEWTEHGKLRHPRYLGLRFDKDAEDVVREGPVD